MDLDQLREKINEIDEQIEQLFITRMGVACEVADFKIKNDLPVFQSGREKDIINEVREKAPAELKNSAEVLFTTIMDISKCKQHQRFLSDACEIPFERLDRTKKCVCAVPGIEDSYSHTAAIKILEKCTPAFFADFEDVFKSVSEETAEFGILPIQNSTAGSVARTYELMKKYDFKIAATTKVKISHCLAANGGVSISDIRGVYSHEQALSQCSEFLQDNSLKGVEFSNTALAAEYVKNSHEPIAAICSVDCAENMGLNILEKNIANANDNYTKFILISKKTTCPDNANIVSVCLSLEHTSSALYRLLTKFSVAGLNLLMIESKPIANSDFDVVFYLDFEGSIASPDVVKLIAELKDELSYFRFLGNYSEV